MCERSQTPNQLTHRVAAITAAESPLTSYGGCASSRQHMLGQVGQNAAFDWARLEFDVEKLLLPQTLMSGIWYLIGSSTEIPRCS